LSEHQIGAPLAVPCRAVPCPARLIQAWTHLGSWLEAVHLRANHPHQVRPAGGPRRHDPIACDPERDDFNRPGSAADTQPWEDTWA
jgi:hypothetical protein